jgi:hypothetical protein
MSLTASAERLMTLKRQPGRFGSTFGAMRSLLCDASAAAITMPLLFGEQMDVRAAEEAVPTSGPCYSKPDEVRSRGDSRILNRQRTYPPNAQLLLRAVENRHVRP